MPLPLIPIGLALGAAYLISKDKPGTPGTPGASLSVDSRGLPPELAKMVDPHMPADYARAELAMMSTNGDWRALAGESLMLAQKGYPVTSATMLAASNYWRQKQGLPPFAFPPNAAVITAAVMSQSAPGQPAQPAPVQPPPGAGPIYGVPPVATATPGGGTSPTPGFVPGPDGSITVNMPGVPPFTISPGIMGQPAQPLPNLPRPLPGQGNTTEQTLPPNFKPAQPPAPPAAPARTYPTGTHTRPDGTVGYTTQKGDVTTPIIAAKFGGQGSDLMKANPGVNWTKNYAGTDLNIPAAWITSAPPAGQRGPNPPGQTSAGVKGPVYSNMPTPANPFGGAQGQGQAQAQPGGSDDWFSLPAFMKEKAQMQTLPGKTPSYSIVIQPPPFTLRAARYDEAGKAWWAEVEFKTPRGPATIRVCVTLPDTVKALWGELAPRALTMAAERMIAAKGDEYSAGAWGVSLPSPRSVVRRGARQLNTAAKQVANRAIAKIPESYRKAVSAPLMRIANARSAADLTSAITEASAIIGSPKIPGTNMSLAALHPYGAAAMFGAKILGEDNTKAILGQVADTLDQVVAEEASSGALKKAGKKILKERTQTVAKDLSLNAKFAREVGIPTLDVHPDLHDAGRMMVSILRGVYLKNPDALSKLKKLAEMARKGDANARILWKLGEQISSAARAMPRSFAAGDGYGDGYGMSGYLPPASPVSAYR
jgi:LysM repeat protein